MERGWGVRGGRVERGVDAGGMWEGCGRDLGGMRINPNLTRLRSHMKLNGYCGLTPIDETATGTGIAGIREDRRQKRLRTACPSQVVKASSQVARAARW